MTITIKPKGQLLFSPGHCFICRNGNCTHYIDTGIMIPGKGAFYICLVCATQIGTLVSGEQPTLDPMLVTGIKDALNSVQEMKKETNDRLANSVLHLSNLDRLLGVFVENAQQATARTSMLLAERSGSSAADSGSSSGSQRLEPDHSRDPDAG